MSDMNRKPKKVIVTALIFSKEQKEALFDLMLYFDEKPEYIRHSKKHIEYRIIFNYATNFSSFLWQWKGLYKQYKFRIQWK